MSTNAAQRILDEAARLLTALDPDPGFGAAASGDVVSVSLDIQRDAETDRALLGCAAAGFPSVPWSRLRVVAQPVDDPSAPSMVFPPLDHRGQSMLVPYPGARQRLLVYRSPPASGTLEHRPSIAVRGRPASRADDADPSRPVARTLRDGDVSLTVSSAAGVTAVTVTASGREAPGREVEVVAIDRATNGIVDRARCTLSVTDARAGTVTGAVELATPRGPGTDLIYRWLSD